MIILNHWESQFVYLAKNHFNNSDSFITDKEDMLLIAKSIWLDRSGIEIKYIHIRYIISFLIELCIKLGMFKSSNTIFDFIDYIKPNSKYAIDNPREMTNNSFAKNIFDGCMSYITFIQIKDNEGNNLISLEPIDEKYKINKEK